MFVRSRRETHICIWLWLMSMLISRTPAALRRGDPTSFAIGYEFAPFGKPGGGCGHNLRAETMDFGGLDSSRILTSRV